jgi:hypothetical protein
VGPLHLVQSRVGVIAGACTGDAELGDLDEEPSFSFELDAYRRNSTSNRTVVGLRLALGIDRGGSKSRHFMKLRKIHSHHDPFTSRTDSNTAGRWVGNRARHCHAVDERRKYALCLP